MTVEAPDVRIPDVRIVDGDSHFREPLDWFETGYPTLAEKIPPVSFVDMVMEVLVGDVLTSMPKGVTITAEDLLNPAVAARLHQKDKIRALFREGRDAEARALLDEARADPELAAGFTGFDPAGYDGAARSRWADERGIDVQVMLPTLGFMPYRNAIRAGLRDEAFQALRAFNDWAAGQLHGYTDRLIPVTLVDLADVDWSLGEIRRMRELGSRVVQVRAEPNGDRSLSHPDFEVFWSAVEDLGMTLLFHVGGGRAAIDTRWVNNGGRPREYQILARHINQNVPELAVGALILGGVLERHPRLRVIVAELGYEWVTHFANRLDRAVTEQRPNGSFDHLALQPSEYFRRQVRVPVLPSATDAVRESMLGAPENIFVFSSDWPHKEGSPDPYTVFEAELAGEWDDTTRARFYGGDLAEFLGV